jgi:integral membrane sensor domain MASE1
MLVGVYLGLVSYHFVLPGSLPTSTALLLPLANIAETSIAWLLLVKIANGFHHWISKQRDIVIFLLAAPWIPALVSAMIAQTLLCGSGVVASTNFKSEVLTYALGNAGGIILITPLILVWRDFRKFNWFSHRGLQVAAHSVIVTTLIVAFYLKAPLRNFVLILLLPLIVWGVWANGLKGATLSFFLISFLFVGIRNEKISKDLHLGHTESAINQTIQQMSLLTSDTTSPNAKTIPRLEEIGILIFFCITMFPLGLAADTVRASQEKDRWVMDSLDSSLWTWTAVTGCVIHQESVSKKIPKGYPLFSKRSRTGQMKIQSIDPSKPAYLSHWVITHVSASGEPLEATGLLHCLRLEEKVEKAEASAEIAKMEATTIRSRINPHLLFNCLTGLRALIQRNPSRARDFITLLAQFLRTAVDSQLNTLIPIEQEVALCRQYLELENMRGKRTSFKVTIPAQARSLRIPPMSIQTLVENAVKHGKYSSKRILWIRISARLGTDKKLVVSVSQPGNLHSGTSEKVSAGIALVRHHLALIYHNEGSLHVQEKRKGAVTATITFPIGSNLG